MARPAETRMARRRHLRLALVVLLAIVSIPFILFAILAGARDDRRH